MDPHDTEKLQGLLVVLTAAGVTRYRFESNDGCALEIELPAKAPLPVKLPGVAPGAPVAQARDYDRLFGGQLPKFGED